MRKLNLLVAGFLVAAAPALWAGDKMTEGPKMPAEFGKLKSLVGTWAGKTKMHGDKEEAFKVTYELTSGGSVVMERLNPGTPHEMVTLYHLDGGKLCMTHYCMLGNSPKMRLEKASEDALSFKMRGKEGISSSKEMHMHALTITWKDADHIAAEWVMYKDGKAQPGHVFNMARRK